MLFYLARRAMRPRRRTVCRTDHYDSGGDPISIFLVLPLLVLVLVVLAVATRPLYILPSVVVIVGLGVLGWWQQRREEPHVRAARPRYNYGNGPNFGVPIDQPPVPTIDKLPLTRTCCNSGVGGLHQHGCRFGPQGPSQAYWSNRR